PEPEPAPDPEPEPEPTLPDGTPEIESSSARFDQGRWTFDLAVSAEPGSTVEAQVADEVRATAQANQDGIVALTFTASNGEVFRGESVHLRFVAGDHAGPPLSRRLLMLIL